MNIEVFANGELKMDGKAYRCALGWGGVKNKVLEGDGATPVGTYPLREVYYRADKIDKPNTNLETRVIDEDDGWCDDPTSPDYNHLINLPSDYRHEKMWRDDDIYDIVIPIGYNDNPVEPGKGSAIFIHLARPDYSATHGCVALSKPDLLEILKKVNPDTQIHIHADKR